MSRPRKSPSSGKETIKSSNGLSVPPYSGRVGGNPHVVYVSYKPESKDQRIMVHNFLGMYAAKWYIEKLIGEDSWEYEPWKYRKEDLCIITDRGIEIRMCEQKIKEIMSYEYLSVEEETWSDDHLAKHIAQLKFGRWEDTLPDNDDNEDKPVKMTEKELRRKRKEKKAKEGKDDKPKKAKVDRDGKITAQDIAEKMGIPPSTFRAALRKLKMTKPTGGWLFNEDEVEGVIKKVKGVLK